MVRFRRAKSAISIMDQFIDRARLPMLKTLCNGNIFFWKEPIQATSSSLATIHRDSLLAGQMDFAMACAMHVCRQRFMSGTVLTELNDQCISVTAEMVSPSVDIDLPTPVLTTYAELL